MIDDEQRRRHARDSRRLMLTATGLICALTILIPLAGTLVSGYFFLRFPLGLFLTAQGAVFGIIAVIFWAAGRQDKLDRRYGFTSEF